MAHYHLCAKVLSRSTRNTVSALAYRAGVDITCGRTGELFDYTKKKVDHVELVLPENAPQWILALQKEILDNRKSGVQKLSDTIEAAEKRVDSQVYRELEFSLPQEFSDAHNKELARDFLKSECARLGIGALANFHFDIDDKTGDRKPHCHALLFMRELTETGFASTKNRTWNSKETHQHFREAWSEIQNEHLERQGFSARVDHRSYEERGIEIEPQMKKGKAVTERLKKGLASFVGDEVEKLQARNLFRINARPEVVFEIVTKDQSTFQWADVQKVLYRYADSLETFNRLNAQLATSKKIVSLNEGVYTTKSLLKIEHQTEEDLLGLKDLPSRPVKDTLVREVLAQHDAKLQAYGGLTSQQKDVIRGLVAPERVKTLVGYAGAGKSTSLAAAKDIWTAAKCQVVGLAPTRKAAQNLKELDINSLTVAKFLKTYEQGRSQYKGDTVFLVDEVGLVDSRTLRSLLQAVTTLKAKVVFVGDPRQLQPISAGPVFRRLLEKVPPFVLNQVVRQKEAWAREASQKFGEGKVHEAMAPYLERKDLLLVPETKEVEASIHDTKDHILSTYAYTKQVTGLLYHQMSQDIKTQTLQNPGTRTSPLPHSLKTHPLYPSFKKFQEVRETAKSLAQHKGWTSDLENALPTGYRTDTKEHMVSDWLKDQEKSPDTSALMVAATRVDVADLNRLAKKALQEAGAISLESRSFQTIELKEDDFGREVSVKRQEDFSVGDQIIFKRNDHGLKVDNGMLGRITSLEKHKIKVQLLGADEREVGFSPQLYPYFQQGWASTIYTTQGATYDRVYALLDRNQNRHNAYVIATRHKDSFKGYAPASEFASLPEVVDTMAKSGDKLLAQNYLDVIEGADVKALLTSDESLLEKLFKPVQQVKNVGQAIKGFLGLTENRQSLSEIDPSKLYSETEALRAIGLLKASPLEQEKKTERASLEGQRKVLGEEASLTPSTGPLPLSDAPLSLKKDSMTLPSSEERHVSSSSHPRVAEQDPEGSSRSTLFDAFLKAQQTEQDLQKTRPHSYATAKAMTALDRASQALVACAISRQELHSQDPETYHRLVQEYGSPALKNQLFQEAIKQAKRADATDPTDLARALTHARQQEETVLKEGQGLNPAPAVPADPSATPQATPSVLQKKGSEGAKAFDFLDLLPLGTQEPLPPSFENDWRTYRSLKERAQSLRKESLQEQEVCQQKRLAGLQHNLSLKQAALEAWCRNTKEADPASFAEALLRATRFLKSSDREETGEALLAKNPSFASLSQEERTQGLSLVSDVHTAAQKKQAFLYAALPLSPRAGALQTLERQQAAAARPLTENPSFRAFLETHPSSFAKGILLDAYKDRIRVTYGQALSPTDACSQEARQHLGVLADFERESKLRILSRRRLQEYDETGVWSSFAQSQDLYDTSAFKGSPLAVFEATRQAVKDDTLVYKPEDMARHRLHPKSTERIAYNLSFEKPFDQRVRAYQALRNQGWPQAAIAKGLGCHSEYLCLYEMPTTVQAETLYRSYVDARLSYSDLWRRISYEAERARPLDVFLFKDQEKEATREITTWLKTHLDKGPANTKPVIHEMLGALSEDDHPSVSKTTLIENVLSRRGLAFKEKEARPVASLIEGLKRLEDAKKNQHTLVLEALKDHPQQEDLSKIRHARDKAAYEVLQYPGLTEYFQDQKTFDSRRLLMAAEAGQERAQKEPAQQAIEKRPLRTVEESRPEKTAQKMPHKEGDHRSVESEKTFKDMAPPGVSLDDIKALTDQVFHAVNLERLAYDLGFIDGKEGRENRDTIRFGRKGSFSIDRQRNLWRDFERGTGGGPFCLLREAGIFRSHEDNLKFLSDYTRGSLRYDIDELYDKKAARQSFFEKKKELWQERTAALALKKEAWEKEDARRFQENQREIQALVDLSVPLQGTQAETYLRESRGIQGALPASLRSLEPGTRYMYNGQQKKISRGALLTLAHDRNTHLKAVQITFLDGKAQRARNAAGVKLIKVTYGSLKGAFVDLRTEPCNPTEPVFMAEGVETGLSVKDAGAKKCVASLGLSNLRHLETSAQQVIICADWDGDGPLPMALQKAEKALQDKGKTVHVVFPVTGGSAKKDFNDVLQEGGVHSVRSCLERALPDHAFVPVVSPPHPPHQKDAPEAPPLSSEASDQKAEKTSGENLPLQRAGAPFSDLSRNREDKKTSRTPSEKPSARPEASRQPASPESPDRQGGQGQTAEKEVFLTEEGAAKEPPALLQNLYQAQMIEKKAFEEKTCPVQISVTAVARERAEEDVVHCPFSLAYLKENAPQTYRALIEEHASPQLKEAVFQEDFAAHLLTKTLEKPERLKKLEAARSYEAQVYQQDPDGFLRQSDASVATEEREEEAAKCPASMAYLKSKDPEAYEYLTQIRQENLQREIQRQKERGFGL